MTKNLALSAAKPPHDVLLAALATEISALRLANADDAAFHKAATGIFARTLEQGRNATRLALEAGGRGLDCAAALSDLEDQLIRAILAYVTTYQHALRDADDLCVIAVGGYGRATLAPGSDIDLLFLLGPNGTSQAEKTVQGVLYILWDLRQKIGHATRNLDEAIKRANDDITIRTTLIDARLVCGSMPMFARLKQRFTKDILSANPREFVMAKLAERDARITKAGESRYLVEPNVKEGKGGLRDLNTLSWIGQYTFKTDDTRQLVKAGLFSPREFAAFERCEEFLWRVRCHLHFVTGRAEDRLSFDIQRQIAERLGYQARSGRDGVERFMKHYFLVAKQVGDLTAIVCAAMEDRHAKPRPLLNRFVQRFRAGARKLAKGDFIIDNGRINLRDPEAFNRDPINLLRLFLMADTAHAAIHPDARHLAALSLKLIDADLRANPAANAVFLDILTSRGAPETILRQMNEAGVLGRFIPDFGRIVAMMQFNMYHHYTVDEHLIRTVGVLADIEAGRFVDDHPLVSKLVRHLPRRRALYVALFLHDIAKGRPEDHSVAGAAVAKRLCPRLGLDEAETELVVWLIAQHLVMSNMAQGRDLSDARTIDTFARQVQTMERLKLLLILTVCDTRAVGPGVWNGWKGELLRTLYWEAEVVLTGGHSSGDRARRVEARQNELRAAMPEWTPDEAAVYSGRHYAPYWLKVDLARQVQHARLLSRAAEGLVIEAVTDAFKGVTEITVIAPDHPRLLSLLAGACAAVGANIVDAHIFTTTDGLALDTLFISRGFEQDADEMRRANRVTSLIGQALRGEVKISDLVLSQRKQSKTRTDMFRIVPQVTIDNELSARFSVIEVEGLDRPGLLYDLTSMLSKLSLNIASSHIVTFGEKAVDAFYVTDLTGQKITSPSRQAAMHKALLAVLGP